MEFLIETVAAIRLEHVVMWLVGGLLIFLAIKKNIEPALLLPMGFGAILVNIPFSSVIAEDLLEILKSHGLPGRNVRVLEEKRPLTLTEVFPDLFEGKRSINVKI